MGLELWSPPVMDSLNRSRPTTRPSLLQLTPFHKQQSENWVSFHCTSLVDKVLSNLRLFFSPINKSRWSLRHVWDWDTTKIPKLRKIEQMGMKKSHERSEILIGVCRKKDSCSKELKRWWNDLLWIQERKGPLNMTLFLACG